MNPSRPSAEAAFGRHCDQGIDFAAMIYAEAEDRLGPRDKPPEAAAVASCVASALSTVDRIIADSMPELRRQQGKPVGCAAGCAMCCHQTIEISCSEVVMIAQAIRGGPDEDSARQAFGAQAAAIVGRSKAERYARGIACGALEGDLCGIYDVRPGACRGYFSLSKLACKKDWRDRMSQRRPAGVPTVGPFQLLPAMAVIGVDLRLRERGLELVRVELAAGIAAALEPGAIEAWLGGGRVFAGLAFGDYPATLDAVANRIGVKRH